MRELTMYETDQTGGGILPALVVLLGGIVGQLAFEAMGGADGIEDGLSELYNFFTDGNEQYQALCNNPWYSEYCD